MAVLAVGHTFRLECSVGSKHVMHDRCVTGLFMQAYTPTTPQQTPVSVGWPHLLALADIVLKLLRQEIASGNFPYLNLDSPPLACFLWHPN